MAVINMDIAMEAMTRKIKIVITERGDDCMIDFHSHIIPKIDDGSRSVEMSADMLHLSYSQGITDIVSTSHFYIDDNDAQRFIRNRTRAYEKLKPALDDKMPNIYLGAEVYYFNRMSVYDGLDLLTINNSRYLLLEMPFVKWNQNILDEVERLIYQRDFKIIIAHIERYIDLQKGTNNINELLSLNPIVQMNGEFINGLFSRKKALSFINNGIVQLIGSDCHNMDKRRPNLDKAYSIIQNKLGIDAVNKINNLGKEILGIK